MITAMRISGLSLLALTGSTQAADYSIPQIRLPLMSKAPVIDGAIYEAEWQGADRMERFGRPEPLAAQSAAFWVGSDGKELFVAVRGETQPGGKLLTTAEPLDDGTDAKTYYDDSIELYICPDPDTAVPQTFVGIFNAKGAIFDQIVGAKANPAWRGKWRVKSSVTGDRWDCEIAIPLSEIGVAAPLEGRQMAVRVARNWQGSADIVQTEWSPLGGTYSNVSTMPRVHWDSKAPVIQVLQLQDALNEPSRVKLRLSNPGQTPLRLVSKVEMSPRESQTTRASEPIALAPGETRDIIVPGAALGSEPIYTRIQVTSADARAVYYLRDFSWQVTRPKTVWTAQKETKTLRTQFSYFPTANTVRTKVNLAGIPNLDQVTGVALEVRRKGETTPLAKKIMPAPEGGIIELMRWDLPPLPDGDLEFVMTTQGIVMEPEVQSFERKTFPWLDSKLGLSDVVVPPFTPIELKGNTLHTVLRSHTVNGIGLWDQVLAQGKPLLKQPMRLEATTGGKRIVARGQVKWDEPSATQANATATWSAGSLAGSTQSHWDYDGMMRCVIKLQPTRQPVDSLTLVIPLDDSEAPLLHACADGLRFNYAGVTPVGTGRVWESSKARHHDIIGTYVPYVWLGGAERGLSVFGENDRGWITDGKTSCQEIVRAADGTLELRLTLIQTPSAWKEPREIEIGFLATPVKPMPENWRLWTVGNRGTKKVPGQHHMAFLGSSLYWGTVTASDEIYPRDADFTLWDKLAETRKTGKIDRAYIDKWMLGYKTADTPAGQRQRIGYKAHIDSGFYSMSTKPDGVLPYTNPRGLRLDQPESRTYLDEWLRAAYPSREVDYAAFKSYGVDPVPSFRDFSAYHWQKMLTTFADGIYWDNGFLASAVNPITSQAYFRPDGSVQPAMGLWNLRATVRRGAVLQQELGRTNRNMVHMTNTALAPILSFTPTILSWEFSHGDIDFQDRYKRDDIMSSSLGRQFGAVPFVLTLIAGNDQEKIRWAARTAAGVMLTHELKPTPASVGTPDFWEDYDRLVEFGYGGASTKVWNYWQPDYPVKITGETSSLLVSKPGELLLIICDWSNGGDLKINLDANLLGFKKLLEVKDAESGSNLPLATDGTISVSLKKHDYKVIHVKLP